MNFLGMGPLELVVIMVLALIFVGPAELPRMARQIGKMVRDFRRATSEMTAEFNRSFSLELEEGESASNLPAGESQPAEAPTATADKDDKSAQPAPVPTSEWAWETSGGDEPQAAAKPGEQALSAALDSDKTNGAKGPPAGESARVGEPESPTPANGKKPRRRPRVEKQPDGTAAGPVESDSA